MNGMNVLKAAGNIYSRIMNPTNGVLVYTEALGAAAYIAAARAWCRCATWARRSCP